MFDIQTFLAVAFLTAEKILNLPNVSKRNIQLKLNF